jgi:hypothetical protein
MQNSSSREAQQGSLLCKQIGMKQTSSFQQMIARVQELLGLVAMGRRLRRVASCS